MAPKQAPTFPLSTNKPIPSPRSKCAWEIKVRQVRENSPVSPSFLFATPIRSFTITPKRKRSSSEDEDNVKSEDKDAQEHEQRHVAKVAKMEETPDTAYDADDEGANDTEEISLPIIIPDPYFWYRNATGQSQPQEYWYPGVPPQEKRESKEVPWYYKPSPFLEGYWGSQYLFLAERQWKTSYSLHKTGEEDVKISVGRRKKYKAGEGWAVVEKNLSLEIKDRGLPSLAEE
ncbi:uncharacterized protein J4E84_006123 [Alternaria hordeiaustralica]|uniref:uncharacterized protein n=1 Tax=Alternaria hordeiaustralica TaxID=1187925 RepID=UPI0020C59F97|nr:uncharacterized protein J4E84_006123 [Alternaria hordeiaustralica]KAI4685395.1 hypothetical protein J4E84_006123 [Alternaria hordeiaustralica]